MEIKIKNKALNFEEQKERVLEHLMQKIKENKQSIDALSDEDLIKNIKSVCNHLLLHQIISIDKRLELIEACFDKLRGLGLIQNFLNDNKITEIMINGPFAIFVEENGMLKKSDRRFKDNQELNDFIHNIFSKCNKRIDNLHPIADAVLPDGSRVNAILSPVSSRGSTLTIRKFCGIKPKEEVLVEQACISREAMNFLKTCILNKRSIFICGGTGSGKTTLLNILSSFIPHNERIVTIEDTCELELLHLENWVSLEAKEGFFDDKGKISIADLIKTSLRMRPDRLIVGEIRGQEAFDLIQAANTGHPGSLSTAHANSCRDMIRRLANLIISNSNLPYSVILENIRSAFPYFVFIEREASGRRFVKEIAEFIEVKDNDFSLKTLFIFNPKLKRIEACK